MTKHTHTWFIRTVSSHESIPKSVTVTGCVESIEWLSPGAREISAQSKLWNDHGNRVTSKEFNILNTTTNKRKGKGCVVAKKIKRCLLLFDFLDDYFPVKENAYFKDFWYICKFYFFKKFVPICFLTNSVKGDPFSGTRANTGATTRKLYFSIW